MSERTSKASAKRATILEGPEPVSAPDFGRAGGVLLEGWASLGGQLFGMMQASWQAGFEAADELRRCESPQQLVEAQLNLSRRACDCYVDGLREVGALVTRTTAEAVEAIAPRTA